ncbi:TPA: hypothetical protein ACPY3Z_004990, partial [Enterobacter roggenkampii]
EVNATSDIFPRLEPYFKTIKIKRRKAKAGSPHTTKNTINSNAATKMRGITKKITNKFPFSFFA